MIFSLLNQPLDAASPEVRSFFLNYLHMYGLENVVVRGVKEMSSDLGLPDRLVSKSLNFLEANHYLVREKLPGRGRPKSAFFPGPRLSAVLSRQSFVVADEPHRLIWMYLFNEGRRPRVPEKNELKLSERFLLCVLLANADNSGCVSGVGFAKLREFTGLAEVRLKRHIKTLEERGYIKQYIAGGIDKYTSRRLTSVYQLDLRFIGVGEVKPKRLDYSFMNIPAFERCVNMCVGLLAVHEVEAMAKKRLDLDGSYWLSMYQVPNLDRAVVGQLVGFFAKNASGPLIQQIDSVINGVAAHALIYIGINKPSWESEWQELAESVISRDLNLETIFHKDSRKKEALIAFVNGLGKELFRGLCLGLKARFPEVKAIGSYFFLPRRAGDETLSFCFYEKVEDREAGN